MLEPLIRDAQDRPHQFTVYRGGEQSEIEAWLSDRSVNIDSRPLPSGGLDSFVEIEKDGEFVGVIGIEALEGLLEPPIVRPGEDASEGYRALFDVLDDTVLTGMTRRELLVVSREIEDRTFRVGTGTLRVSFQTFSTFKTQVEVYRTLATETSLDIHIYGAADWTPPEIASITYHEDEADTFGRYWALAFDGGGDDTQVCGLLAQEQANEYNGFWTDDPEKVAEISTGLSES